MPHPMQPPVKDHRGTIRFKENRIVSALLDAAREGRKIDLNDIACMDFPNEDRVQFAQLIGYSLGGFHELSYVPDSVALAASAEARKQWPDAIGCRDDGCEIHCGVDDDGNSDE